MPGRANPSQQPPARAKNSDVGLISDETIRRVAEANDIVDVVGGYFPLKRAGANFRALCPFHREKSPSFHVNPARQTFHCFGCGAGGGVLRFVMDYEHVDFPTAVRRLAQRAGIPVIEEAGGDDDRLRGQRQRLLAIHAEAADWFHRQLTKSPDAEHARGYLKSRGISSEVAKSWLIGYAPDSWDAVLAFLQEKKFTMEEILTAGLATTRDDDRSAKPYARFRDRVMFPIRNDYGEVIAFSGRVLDPDAKAAKYVNSPETPIFSKGRVLYGLDKTKRDLIDKKAAIVCEGQIDLISAFEAGVRHVIAPQGTAFTPDQARLLARFVETVLLCFDSDSAGQKAAARSLPALLTNGLQVRMVTLPAGEDPDSLIRKSGPEAFLKAVDRAKDYFDHALDLAEAAGETTDPAGKSRVVKSIGPALALVQDPTLREGILGKMAARLGVPQSAIRPAMKPPKVDSPAESPSDDPVPEVIPLSAGLQMLCQLALQSRDVREWLREQPPAAEMDPAGALLDNICAADLADDDPSSVTTFLTRLGGAAERTLSVLASARPLPEPLTRARETWTGLQSLHLRQTIEGLKSRLSQPGLPGEEVMKIQKQILDLKIRVSDVFRPV
ncbi:MAG: DNA primase [Terrimicrobiaceae bacterium]|nr:DNA primase [Terrimicrobiaceae bacterium]